ncbi:APC family permease [Rudaeicoccus suwonensis]|uniref:Amino acid/polyamine/organocation transporter (APC superfamily) n=1 Tax=Rudaeicoccus suwonensis TaxID=657409 RepID=A0A561E8V6_9MICO|nr:APC family permease [Rudaeicoccus suwonensis]TWE12055.1 amino acid/polyamine/organocation transporter (APC superfamily) [Rudaeicoccus suwonensis]
MTMLDKGGPSRQPELEAEGMSRDVGFFGLLWASEGSLIGSGWLFGALSAATIAGPSAIIGWIIASIIVIILALIHAELGGMFPVSGGTSRYPHYAFGGFAGATFGWFSYIQAATVAPIEVLAAVQYASSMSWAKHLWSSHNGGELSGSGIVVAIILMLIFTAINLVGIQWMNRVNSVLTSWKVVIPVLTIIVLMLSHFHGSNFHDYGGFFIHGSEIKSIMLAIPAGGIVFALLGFEQAVQLGGESKNPGRDMPRAVIWSILIGAAIYILVQVAFIAALQPHLLMEAKTWPGLTTSAFQQNNATAAALNSAPFYEVATLAGLGWLAFLLRVDAIVSPAGTGLIYLTSSSRLSYGLSRNGFVPKALESNTKTTKVPWVGIIIAAVIGMVFLLPFPSWGKLVGVVTSASVMMYAGAPLAMGALRMQKPDLPRPYRLPMGNVLAPLGFIFANFIIYWSSWTVYSTLMLVMLVGAVIMLLSGLLGLNDNLKEMDWRAAYWIIPYLIGMGVISYLGGFGNSGGEPSGIVDDIGIFNNVLVGGRGHIGLYWDLLVIAIFSLVIYYLAMATRQTPEQVDETIEDVYPMSGGGH